MNTLYRLLWGVIFIWAKYMDFISSAPKGGVFRFDSQSFVGFILLSGIYLFPLFKMAVNNTNLLEWKKSIALSLSTILAFLVGTFDISKKAFLIPMRESCISLQLFYFTNCYSSSTNSSRKENRRTNLETCFYLHRKILIRGRTFKIQYVLTF